MRTLNYQKINALPLPGYFYSEAVLRQQVKKLQEAVPEEMGIFYSFKANANERLVKVLQGLAIGADVASVNELKAALRTSFNSQKIEFTGPGKSEEALRLAIQSEIASIVVESVEELLLINQISAECKKMAAISVRVNPEMFLSPLGKPQLKQSSQFGVDEAQVGSFIAALQKCPHVKLVGVHIFSQSQILDGQILAQNFAAAMDAVLRVTKHLSAPLQMVNLGGGFGIPYYEGQTELQLKSLKNSLQEILNKARAETHLQSAKFFVESGRFISGPAGVYVAPVLYCKESQGKKIAVLAGGLSHNMALCGVGQLLRKNYNVQVLLNPSDQSVRTPETEMVNLVGPSCYSLDTLGVDMQLPHLQRGDLVVFENCGSYGASFSPVNFLSFDPAKEYFIDDL